MKTSPQPDEPTPSDATLEALFSAVRTSRPDTSRAEFGFETRLRARLAEDRSGGAGWQEFTVWCWRLLPAFAAITLLCTLRTALPGGTPPVDDPAYAATAAPALPEDDDVASWLAVELPAPI